MTTDELTELFEKHDGEFLKFDRIHFKLNRRPDIHAFILLDELVPGTTDMVAAASHDEIFLAISVDALARVAGEKEVVELIRCGVRLDTQTDSLAMFV